MKTHAHPLYRSFAIFSLGLVALAQCNKSDTPARADTPPEAQKAVASVAAPVASASNSIALVSEGLSPSFRAVASRLELGARSFEYSEAGGTAVLAAMMDEMLKSMPASERKNMPPDFSVAKLFSLLGMDSVIATGSSARAQADGSFHSLSFAYAPKGRKGLLTLSGGAPSKLLLLELAPKDTDLALEFTLNLKDIARESLPTILAMMPKEEAAKLEQGLAEPIPGLGVSSRQLLEKLDARAGVFARLDPSQKYKPAPDGPTLPGVDAVIVLERLGWLVEALKPQFLPQLKSAGSPISVTEEGGVLTLKFTRPAGPPPMDFQPVLRYDPKADRIVLATRPALFDTVIAGKEKISQNADFTAAWRGLPTEGNSCLYASPRLLQTLSDAIVISAPKSGSPSDALIVQKMIEWVKPYFSRGQAIVLANQADGILSTANLSVPLGSSSSLATITTVSMLASLAMPAYAAVTQKAQITKEINAIRQLATALKVYASDHQGKYPEKLSDLVKEGILTDTRLFEYTDPATQARQPWLYNPALTDSSPTSEIVLAAPKPMAGQKRIVCFNDNAATTIPEAEFQKKWGQKAGQ